MSVQPTAEIIVGFRHSVSIYKGLKGQRAPDIPYNTGRCITQK